MRARDNGEAGGSQTVIILPRDSSVGTDSKLLTFEGGRHG